MAGRHRPGVDGLQRDQRFQPQMPPRATLTQRSNTHGFSAQQDPSSRFVPPYYSTQPSSQTVSHSKPAPDVRKPVEDLMSSPLDPAASATTNMVSIPAPPIPPNPEKDALLRTISASLNSQIVQITSKNVSAIPSLESQYTAMQQAHQDMGSEVAQLKSLDAMLSSNEKLLHETLRDADKKMESVRNKEKPNVDDVLVAPTTVAEQLYGLVAEEQSLGDAMFALTRALDRGRISAEVYTKVRSGQASCDYILTITVTANPDSGA